MKSLSGRISCNSLLYGGESEKSEFQTLRSLVKARSIISSYLQDLRNPRRVFEGLTNYGRRASVGQTPSDRLPTLRVLHLYPLEIDSPCLDVKYHIKGTSCWLLELAVGRRRKSAAFRQSADRGKPPLAFSMRAETSVTRWRTDTNLRNVAFFGASSCA